jgi:hypothetical protein
MEIGKLEIGGEAGGISGISGKTLGNPTEVLKKFEGKFVRFSTETSRCQLELVRNFTNRLKPEANSREIR